MSSETRGLLEAIPPTFQAPEMEGVHATYRFDVEGVGQWTVEVADTTVTLKEGAGEKPPDCTFRGTDHEIALVLRGEQNVITSALQGRINVEGDLAAAQRLRGLRTIVSAERSPTP